MNFQKVSLTRTSLKKRCREAVKGVIIAIITIGCINSADSDDADERIVHSASMLNQNAETARASGWTTEIVHYDFVEDGELKGGVVEIPSAPPSLDAAFVSAAPLWNVVTLQNNGDSDNRIDIVVVGDGYTNADLTTFETHTSNVITNFFNEEPLSQYQGLFNVHRVDVISNDSGVDNDPTQGILRDTALDMQYWCSGTERLLCVNTSKALAAAAEAPDADQILAIANSSKYGGAGYRFSELGTLAGDSSAAVEIALHEIGHSFADLADEYDYGGPATWTGGEPSEVNVSTHTAAQMTTGSLKWYRWLSHPDVDTFEGAKYSLYDIYRPTNESKMRSLNRPFDPVNVEQFVLKIYEIVDPIDSASPAGTYTEDDTLSVTPVSLSHHDLDVQWKLDGIDIPGATQNTLSLASLNLTPGTYTVSVQVVDNTDLVRNEDERNAIMTSRRDWTVEISGSSSAICDNGICEHTEDCISCPQDCGECPQGGCTCPDGCDAVVPQSVDFVMDGADNTCYFFSGSAGNYINNWNNDNVNLNGMDITNTMTQKKDYPAMVDGGYYLYIDSSFAWSHVEVRN